MKDLKIYAKTVDEKAVEQINKLMEQDAFKKAKVRIMSDVHAGKGCVIGFTSNITDKIIPNIVGVDLYCGMLVVKLGNIELNLEEIDNAIKVGIPAGFNVHEELEIDDELQDLYNDIESLKCFKEISYNKQIRNGVGTLGGGNHFIEIDVDDDNNKYLVIHSGSRNLGAQVAKVYQDIAVNYCHGGKLTLEERNNLIERLRFEGREQEIQFELKKGKEPRDGKVENDLCYLEGIDKQNYLNDIRVCYRYSHMSRQRMALVILNSIFKNRVKIINDKFYIDGNVLESFETLHNYIDLENGFIRKGAVSAKRDEILIIPINMRDGSLICVGKGNGDWNNSAPHGAGRLMSRAEAKKRIALEEYQNSMNGIYTTTANITTLDEAPQAYKPIEEIKEMITDTVDIIKQIKPIYNFKASEEID